MGNEREITRKNQLDFPANFEIYGILVLVKCVSCDKDNPKINSVRSMLKSTCAWCGWKEKRESDND